jgi:hypothetical protein
MGQENVPSDNFHSVSPIFDDCAGHFIEQLFHVAMHRLTQLFCRNLDMVTGFRFRQK